jgi:hypothetical protein
MAPSAAAAAAAAKESQKKKGGLTLAQLASYDDVITDALVDRVCYKRLHYTNTFKHANLAD